MSKEVYRYTFKAGPPFEDIQASLLLATLATESLHGESEVRLKAATAVDDESRTCVVDASTPVGADLNRLFVGFLRREFGETSFHVETVEQEQEVSS